MPMPMRSTLLLLASLLASSAALHMPMHRPAPQRRAVSPRMEFGTGFGHYYSTWDAWVSEYPAADREAYPALFSLPDHCYEITLNKPLGIAFIENEKGGVEVDYLVEGGNADASGVIKAGDVLLATTA